MKKRIITTIVIMCICMLPLMGCKKKVTCDFCGETKMCSQKSVDGEKVYICDDCQKEINDFFK